MKKLITGNEAVAYGSLCAGVNVVTGYPGTPSTGCITSLLNMNLKDTHVEWSVNEKVALEIASGVAWTGRRALCTMKMSGVNVAYDSLVSVAYSGCDGGLVIYVADDPGANAGMCEQDSRYFAMMADMPMLEPATVAETYELTILAFDLSEKIKGPVFLRLVTGIAESSAIVEIKKPELVSRDVPLPKKDIERYTKAGSIIVLNQHLGLINRLEQARQIIETIGINKLNLSNQSSGLGILASGITSAYLRDGFEMAAQFGFNKEDVSTLEIKVTNPFPTTEVHKMLEHCQTILILEELEPLIERSVYVEALKVGYRGKIIGKLDSFFSRTGEYGMQQVVQGIDSALHLGIPGDLFVGNTQAQKLATARPITVCAGCPHRGTYIAIENAIKKMRLKKNEVVVTGDIGCTILGMNPPFDLIWTEVSMGASVGLAQGYVYANVKTPVIATIGDSTFFHAGIPGLINAIQHQVDLTLIILDNRWTAMTGMQSNPGTPCGSSTKNSQEIDIARIIPALGIEHFWIIDPFKLKESSNVIYQAIKQAGVKVILARQECAIQAQRMGKKAGTIKVIEENCNLCKLCLVVTGCSALIIGTNSIEINTDLCYGCGICSEICNRDALIWEAL